MLAKFPTNGEKIYQAVNIALITALLFILVYPLWYVLLGSFSDVMQMRKATMPLFVHGFSFDNYRLIFSSKNIWIGYRNTIGYTLFGTLANVMLSVLTAFPFTRMALPGRRWLVKVFVLTTYISGGLIPTYLVVDSLHLTNTVFALIIPNLVNVGAILVSIAFIRGTIPDGLIESAMIDGASYPGVFFRIVLPLSAPLIGVLTLATAMSYWNSYTQALIYLRKRELQPLQLVLREILLGAITSTSMSNMIGGEYSKIDYAELTRKVEGIKFSSIVVSSAPLLMIYPFLKKYFATGIMLGGIKE